MYNGVKLMIDLTKAVRKILPQGKYLVSHAPQTPYLTLSSELVQGVNLSSPGYWGSYLPIMAQVGDDIDFLNIQAYNNCPWEDCPVGAAIVNGLSESQELPRIYTINGKDTMDPIPAEKLLYGMLIERDPLTGKSRLAPPCIASKDVPKYPDAAKSPGDHPWCKLTGAEMDGKVGTMFWLDKDNDSATADAIIDTWYGQPKKGGALSPRNRVVYYTNTPASFPLPAPGQYSRANTVILGFIYPVQNTAAIPVFSLDGISTIPNPAGVPDWALFGFNNTSYLDYVKQLKNWRATDPTNRKVMVSVGGAFAVPDYATWANGNNVDLVAKGLKQFADQWLDAFGYPLDGIDIDYEDSPALASHPSQLTSTARVSSLPSTNTIAAQPPAALAAAAPYAILLVVITALLVVAAIAAACVPRVRAQVLSRPEYLGPFVTAAILAFVGLATSAGLLGRAVSPVASAQPALE
jgi:hypothetical protein